MSNSYAQGAAAPALLEETIGANFERTVARFGDREALISFGQELRYTWTELNDAVDELARGLIESAECVFGGSRHLSLAAPLIHGTARPWGSPFDPSVSEVLGLRGRPVCVLASGDQGVHRIGLGQHVVWPVVHHGV